MNWIPVTQEMPKPDKRVLVRFLNGDREIPRITIGCYLPARFRDASTCDNDPDEWADLDKESDNYWWPEGWWEDVCIAECVDKIHKVTHWMPLPSVHVSPNT